MGRILLLAVLLLVGRIAQAAPVGGTFPSIDGGNLSIEAWRGQPVLVVNTASHCGYTGQYAALQRVYDTYSNRGLVVLAVPSDDFNQELDSAAEVKAFCELNYDLTLPMTDITRIKGRKAHPFYKAVKAETGFVPRWNFNKVLIAPDGSVAGTWGASTKPDSGKILNLVKPMLN